MPGTSVTDSHRLQPHVLDGLSYLGTKNTVTVMEQVPNRRCLWREGFPQLLGDPGGGGVGGYVGVENTPRTVMKDDEHVQRAEEERGQGQKIHGGGNVEMVVEKGTPGLNARGIRHPPGQILAYGSLGDLVA